MAELADAADSKSAEGNLVGVRPPLPAPIKSMVYEINASSDAFFCAQTVPKVDIKILKRRTEVAGILIAVHIHIDRSEDGWASG
jgi:hypothetical protein